MSIEPRIAALQDLSIQPYVAMAPKFPSQDEIDKIIATKGNGRSYPGIPFIDPVSFLLRKYRDAVQWLLRQDFYTGVSRDDFELFRAQMRISLFTCCLPSCPGTSTGYETEAQLREHELQHRRTFHCSVADCQYPHFGSAQSLKNHVKKTINRLLPRGGYGAWRTFARSEAGPDLLHQQSFRGKKRLYPHLQTMGEVQTGKVSRI